MHQMTVAASNDGSAVWGDIYEAVARLIAPTGTPSWLRDYFANWAPSLTVDSGVVSQQPTRKVMNSRLLEISEAASLLEKALADTAVREFLEAAGRVRIENLGGLQVALQQIARHAAKAANSPQLITSSGSVKAGKGPAKPPDSLGPHIFCAAIVAQAWKFIHGDYPKPRNELAAKACEALWKAAVGERNHSWGTHKLEAWRPHLKAAGTAVTREIREECQRHLDAHSKQESLSTE